VGSKFGGISFVFSIVSATTPPRCHAPKVLYSKLLCLLTIQTSISSIYLFILIELYKAISGKHLGKLMGSSQGSSCELPWEAPWEGLETLLEKLVWDPLRSSPGDHWSSSLVRETPRGVRGIPCSFWRLLEAPGGHPETLRDCAGAVEHPSLMPCTKGPIQ